MERPGNAGSANEKRKEDLQDIERKRTELLREHQKMPKRSQKPKSLQDKKRQFLNQEMEEREALFETRFRALSEKSGDCRKAAAELDNEIQALQAGEERKGSRRSGAVGRRRRERILGRRLG